jgi:outer membrane protein
MSLYILIGEGSMSIESKEGVVRRFAQVGTMLSVLIFVSAAGLQAQEPTPEPLTLGEALEHARANSPRLAAARQGITTEEADISAAKAMRWPRLDVGGAFQAVADPTQTAAGFPLTGLGQVPAGQPLSRQYLNGGAYATLPIYLGGRIGAATRLAEAERDLSREIERDVERDLVFDVTRSYARLVELERDVRAAERSEEALVESRRVIEQMVDLGKAPRVDLLKVGTRLADVRADLIEFRNARRIEAGRLNALMGRPVGAPVAVERELPRPAVALSAAEAAEAALRRNPEYRLAQQRVTVAERAVGLAETQLRPTVSIGAGYRALSADPFSDAYSGAPVAGIAFSLPAFDRTLSRRVEEAESRELERQAELAQLRLDVEERAHTAYLRVEDARERIRATEAAIAFAEEVLRIEQEKQRLGRGTIEDLLDAQAALLTSEANYYRALSDYTTAVAALERETGLDLIQTEG